MNEPAEHRNLDERSDDRSKSDAMVDAKDTHSNRDRDGKLEAIARGGDRERGAFGKGVSWRATIEKSAEQRAATSVTEHGHAHLIRHAKTRARLGSAMALKKAGSRSVPTFARLLAACLGEIDCLYACVMMKVYKRCQAISMHST